MKIDPEAPDPKQPSNMSKYYKVDEVGRIGRLYRGEKKYHLSKTHTGKGKTLRDHRTS